MLVNVVRGIPHCSHPTVGWNYLWNQYTRDCCLERKMNNIIYSCSGFSIWCLSFGCLARHQPAWIRKETLESGILFSGSWIPTSASVPKSWVPPSKGFQRSVYNGVMQFHWLTHIGLTCSRRLIYKWTKAIKFNISYVVGGVFIDGLSLELEMGVP